MNHQTKSNKIQLGRYASILVGFFLLTILISFCGQDQTSSESHIPLSSQQMIVVITESFESSAASLYRYQRAGDQADWKIYEDPIPAIVGKNGLGWGIGLHTMEKRSGPVKREGDGKSPAGIFSLTTVFGFAPPGEMAALKLPYQHIIELVECVDDPSSVYYNSIIQRNQAEQIDWQSSERMWRARLWYDLGVVVDHNRNPTEKNAGSCIFLHNWANPQDSTSGCTAMSPSDMKDIVYWLDESKHPVLLQLSRPLYIKFQESWKLPVIPDENKPPNKDVYESSRIHPVENGDAKTYVFNCQSAYDFTVKIEKETAWLFLPDTTVALAKQNKEPGDIYQTGRYTFWHRGDNSKLAVGNRNYENCRNSPSKALWEAAKLNGVDFRAVGNEPGWFLELKEGEELLLITNYGRDSYQFTTPPPQIDKKSAQTVYQTVNNGNTLTLIIEDQPCTDNMNGLRFESSVTVVLNGQKYVGCGRALH